MLVPEDRSVFLAHEDFEKHVHALLTEKPEVGTATTEAEEALEKMDLESSTTDTFSVLPDTWELKDVKQPGAAHILKEDTSEVQSTGSPFIDALKNAQAVTSAEVEDIKDLPVENRMFTENEGIAHRSTNSSLLDLFVELEKTISGLRLRELLESAWAEDSLATLKIIWNARSIHLGKGDKETFYRCLGWMKVAHPRTLLTNLPWIFRSTIEKKVKKEAENAPVMVESDTAKSNNQHDVLHGVSHGYWKDLLNILVLAVNEKLDVLEDPRSVLNKKNDQARQKSIRTDRRHTSDTNRLRGSSRIRGGRRLRGSTRLEGTAKKISDIGEKPRHQRLKEANEYVARQKQEAKERKHEGETSRHDHATKMWEVPFYRALNLTIARLFAEQLSKDMDLLKSGKRQDVNAISFAAKWAPSLEGFHDKYTFVASSIAEVLYPREVIGEVNDTRETYIRRARESYRRLTLSPLRKALEVVEREISAKSFENINYSKVPSIAMDHYKDLFVRQDLDRFNKYIEKVAEGKSRISGAVLMPAILVHQARSSPTSSRLPSGKDAAKHLLEIKIAQIQSKVLDGQWAALVKRIKDNGTLSSSIAVCDVSGSMTGPIFPDKTQPVDTAVGLSLLVSEVTEPPFGGHFIGFSAAPMVYAVGGAGDQRSFREKVSYIEKSSWDMNTNFTAVFEDLILPMALEHKLKQEDMVKQVFVFSDMQFDAAETAYRSSGLAIEKWETAYERIKRKFEEAGYELPKLVFWNLAGGRAGYTGSGGDPVAPKPVTKDTQGTVMVSGYSQGMMKMFLENGQFEEEDEEGDLDEEMVEVGEDEEGLVEVKQRKKGGVDPMAGLWKAIGHKAYGMLRVVD